MFWTGLWRTLGDSEVTCLRHENGAGDGVGAGTGAGAGASVGATGPNPQGALPFLSGGSGAGTRDSGGSGAAFAN